MRANLEISGRTKQAAHWRFHRIPTRVPVTAGAATMKQVMEEKQIITEGEIRKGKKVLFAPIRL